MIDLPTTRRNLRRRLAVHRVDCYMPVPTATLTALLDALDCYSPHVKADTPDPRLHVLARRPTGPPTTWPTCSPNSTRR